MKVKVTVVYTVNDDEREAINHHFGLKGKATHSTVHDFFRDDFDLTEAMKNWYQTEAKRYAKLAGVDASE